MIKIKLHWWILIGIVIGAITGTVFNRTYYPEIAREAESASITTADAVSESVRAMNAIEELVGEANEIGSVKPEAEIFDHVVRKLAVDASRVCFFDDTAVNVEAAQRVGLTAFLTDGIVELEDRLDRLGVLA